MSTINWYKMKEMSIFNSKILKQLNTFLLLISFLLFPISARADHLSEMEERKSWPIQSNEVENWPEGPAIGSASAILMDADSGIILYEKNIHEEMFPASTTKLMTCLLAMEKEGVKLSDMVPFSYEAVYTVPWDGSNMGMDAGEAMTLEDCLYGILVLSANEVSNAVGEYVSGDIDSFVELMNKRAKELGCENTHFNNAHGYTDSNHYTSAYDLALIGREFFKNELLAKMSRTKRYHWYPTDTQPDDIDLPSRNYFLNGSYNYNGLVGSKTGFTDESRQVLVTCAERNGMRLVCVVMMQETPYQYDDTVTLFNYGFNNFEKIKVADYETKYVLESENFFETDYDVFGNSSSFMSLDSDSEIILPKNCSFSDLTSNLIYREDNPTVLADIEYSYNGKYLGSASLMVSKEEETSFVFKEDEVIEEKEEEKPTFIYVNRIIKWIGIVFGVVFVVFLIKRIISNFHFARNRKYIMRNYKKKRRR